MDRLIAQDAILRILFTMNRAEDKLDGTLYKSLFIPDRTVAVDISSHLPDSKPYDVTPTQLWDQFSGILAGFTATHHVAANPVVDFEDAGLTKARVTTQVIAYHCIEEDGEALKSVLARGTQELEVEVWEGEWKCRAITIKRDVPLDNPSLYDVARQRVKQGLRRKSQSAA